ncbi:MAG: HupE/UreJ family protein [Methylococcales bacterium]|nr:HupE/UreJ family protein [Methylococcales bacterium]
MLAVGVWAAQLRGQAIWMLPLAFVGVMSLGGLAGVSGIAIPSVEGIILLSCAVFSVLITRKVRFSAKINVLIVAFFAFFHGFAHGQEISASASLISYTLGFMLATLLLHGAGILIAKLAVLSMGCLLTIVFSSATIAVDEPTEEFEVKRPALAQSGNLAARMASDQYAYFAVTQAKSFVSGSTGQCLREGADMPSAKCGMADGLNHRAIADTPSKPVHTQIEATGKVAVLSPKPGFVPCLVSWSDQPISNTDYIVNNSLDFKRYYPDINHTPGKNLLSNGVGLTSPPVVYPAPVFASQVPASLSNTAFIPAIADFQSQLSFARFPVGNLPRFTLEHYQQRNALQCTVTGVSYRNIFAASLMRIIGSVRADTPIFKLEVAVTNRKNQPSGKSTPWSTMAVAI